MRRSLALLGVTIALAACGDNGQEATELGAPEEQPTAATARRVTVIAEGCALDPGQLETLQSPSARKVISEVVLLCGQIRNTSQVLPVEANALASLTTQINTVRGLGYKARVGVTMVDETGATYPNGQVQKSFASAQWQASIAAGLVPLAQASDGLEIDARTMWGANTKDLASTFNQIRASIGPNGYLSILAPSTNLDPNGSALTAVSNAVNRVRVMTLDYSTGQGPAIDPGWAASVETSAQMIVPTLPVDVAFPLYAKDYSGSDERSLSYLEARGLASEVGATPVRIPQGTLHFEWADSAGNGHSTWFEDGESTSRVLAAWDTATLPNAVGVVFYGLGSEDPLLWDTLARGMK